MVSAHGRGAGQLRGLLKAPCLRALSSIPSSSPRPHLLTPPHWPTGFQHLKERSLPEQSSTLNDRHQGNKSPFAKQLETSTAEPGHRACGRGSAVSHRHFLQHLHARADYVTRLRHYQVGLRHGPRTKKNGVRDLCLIQPESVFSPLRRAELLGRGWGAPSGDGGPTLRKQLDPQ